MLIVIQEFLVSGVRFQLIRFLLLTPEPRLKGFRKKMNKLMCEKHFNKPVMLPCRGVGIKEMKYERTAWVGYNYRDLVCVAGLYPTKIRNFHLTERFLSGDKQ